LYIEALFTSRERAGTINLLTGYEPGYAGINPTAMLCCNQFLFFFYEFFIPPKSQPFNTLKFQPPNLMANE
jgi:hypothetical protein